MSLLQYFNLKTLLAVLLLGSFGPVVWADLPPKATTPSVPAKIRPEVDTLLKQSAEVYRHLKSYRCKAVFQNESGFADAMNMSTIWGQAESMTAHTEADTKKTEAIRKQIEALLDKASDQGDKIAEEAMQLTPLPPSTLLFRKQLTSTLRSLFSLLKHEAPSIAFQNWQDIDRAIASLETAPGTYTLAMERPNRYVMSSNTAQLLTGSTFMDGSLYIEADLIQKEYLQKTAPASLLQIPDAKASFTFNPILELFLGTWSADDSLKAMLPGAQVGQADLGGDIGPTQVLILPLPEPMGGVERIYFDVRRHLIRRIRMDTPLISMTTTLEGIHLDEPVSASLFHFNPPEGFKRVTAFTEPSDNATPKPGH